MIFINVCYLTNHSHDRDEQGKVRKVNMSIHMNECLRQMQNKFGAIHDHIWWPWIVPQNRMATAKYQKNRLPKFIRFRFT